MNTNLKIELKKHCEENYKGINFSCGDCENEFCCFYDHNFGGCLLQEKPKDWEIKESETCLGGEYNIPDCLSAIEIIDKVITDKNDNPLRIRMNIRLLDKLKKEKEQEKLRFKYGLFGEKLELPTSKHDEIMDSLPEDKKIHFFNNLRIVIDDSLEDNSFILEY